MGALECAAQARVGPAMSEPSLPSAGMTAYLERHAWRRAQSIPTLSVLRGPIGLGVQAWRRWAEGSRRTVVVPTAIDPVPAVLAWTAAVIRERDLTADALGFLCAPTQFPIDELRTTFLAWTLHDLERFWEKAPLDRRHDPAARLCCELTRCLVLGEALAAKKLAGRLAGEAGAAWQGILQGLTRLVPPEAWPALLFAPPEGALAGAVDAMARSASALLEVAPQLPAALVAEAWHLDVYLGTARESRTLTMVREGLVPVPVLDEQAIRQRVAAEKAEELAGPIQRLVADGASDELAQAFGEAVACLADASSEEGLGRARSAAEKFLYERLASLPRTAGKFVLNAPLDFTFGNKPAEVDLFAADLRLAIELDGYFHFAGPDAYRRDRRKDWELQRRGYMVLRFLAEDVVARLEEILDTILAAVEHCERRLGVATEAKR